MNEKMYTTGELAKLCHVTTRTVQYYDKESIVQPSKGSEGGRRIYTENDLQKFQLACLYKKLGLSLKDIKDIFNSNNHYKVLMELLIIKQDKIDNQIQDLLELKTKLAIILDEMSINKTISIANDQELNILLLRKERHKKINRITYLLLSCYIIILLLSFIVGTRLGGLYLYLTIGLNILLLFILIFMHSTNNAYVCPNCGKKFTISFVRDMLTLNNGKKGKYLKCPDCHQRNWMVETY